MTTIFAENPRGSSLGSSLTREDLALNYADLDGSQESCPYTRSPADDTNRYGDFAGVDKIPFLKTLMEAESAANSAAIQLVSFKEAMEDEFADSRQSATNMHQITRQRALLLEKLDDFKRINKSVRQKLKKLQESEADRINTVKQIEILKTKITQAESENQHLKRDFSDKEKLLENLIYLQKKEQENIEVADQTNRSVEATRAHLQGQLRQKEANNNRLTLQLRALERTLTKQKLEIDGLKGGITTLSEKTDLDKEALKKATRAQKQRAERFEAAADKCHAQLRRKDVELASALSERDSWKRKREQEAEEKNQLVTQIQLLKCQTTDLSARLQRERDEFTSANLSTTERIEKLKEQNGRLNNDNVKLKELITELEQQFAQSEAALMEERLVLEKQKHQAEQHHSQGATLQAEVNDLRIKNQSLVRETEHKRESKKEEVVKVRRELQGRVEELEGCPGLLDAAKQSLLQCQENLRRSERKCSQKSESIRQLQVKLDSQTKRLESSTDMRESILEANSQLQEKMISLEKKVEDLQRENQESVRRLAGQDEALSYSTRQLDQRSAECQALSRQLEAALLDVKQQVTNMKAKAVTREEALQNKILELEAEKSRRDSELNLVRQSKRSVEKQFEMRMKDLQLSLDQSESHKQSIQNYVDFLKNSYQAMDHRTF